MTLVTRSTSTTATKCSMSLGWFQSSRGHIRVTSLPEEVLQWPASPARQVDMEQTSDKARPAIDADASGVSKRYDILEKVDHRGDLEHAAIPDCSLAPLSQRSYNSEKLRCLCNATFNRSTLVLIVLMVGWHLFAAVSVIASKAFYQRGGSPMLLSGLTFAVGSLPLLLDWNALRTPQPFLLPTACLHCINGVLTNLAVGQSSIRAVYTIKSLEPCLTALFDYVFFSCSIPFTSVLCLAAVPLCTLIAIQGDYTIDWLTATAILHASMCVSARTVLLKDAVSGSDTSPVQDYARINFVSLMLSSLFLKFAEARPFSAARLPWADNMYQLVAVSCFATLTYNFLSFRILYRITAVGHSLNNVLKRCATVIAGVLHSGQSLSASNVVALFGLSSVGIYGSFAKQSFFMVAIVGLALVIMHLFRLRDASTRSGATTFRSLEFQQHCADFSTSVLPLYSWVYPGSDVNFGDALGPALIRRILGHDKSVETISERHSGQAAILTIGSILHFARSCDIVWGSGWHGEYEEPLFIPSQLDIRAVRGPLTRKRLLSMDPTLHVPEIYGDPALLLPTFFPEFVPKKHPALDSNVIVVLHGRDRDRMIGSSWYRVISALAPSWESVVSEIVNASFVISTSLHGLIVADAYGIPNRPLILNLEETRMKYADYYLGTGRSMPQNAYSIEDAVFLGPTEPLKFRPQALLDALPLHRFSPASSHPHAHTPAE